MDFAAVQKQALAFRDERNWKQFHDAKDLALSISLESSELLELFQWSNQDTEVVKNRAQMKEELADILIYAIYFADHIGADIPEIIAAKIAKNAKKYPVDKCYGSSEKPNPQ